MNCIHGVSLFRFCDSCSQVIAEACLLAAMEMEFPETGDPGMDLEIREALEVQELERWYAL